MGVFDYLPKPISSADIINVVKNAYQLKQLKDEKRRLEEENRIYREQLEQMVAERTEKLIQTNKVLEEEIIFRGIIQTELENSKEKLILVINGLPLLIAYVDKDLKILLSNTNFQKFFKSKNVHPQDNNLQDVLGSDNWQRIQNFVNEVLKGKKVRITKHFLLEDDCELLYQVQLIPHKDTKGEVKAFIFLAEDITELSALEKAHTRAQQLEALSLMAEGIANDINNILMVIFGNLSLIKPLNEHFGDISQSIKAIGQAAEKIKELTRQLLLFSWKGPGTLKNFELSEVVQRVVTLTFKNEVLQYRFKTPSEPIIIEADEVHISQAIYNLTKNILQVMQKNDVLEISLDRSRIENETFYDLTPGEYAGIHFYLAREIIKPEEMARLFDPYYRWSKNHSRLDLATVYAVIRNHKGTVFARTQAGQTSFHIFLPYKTFQEMQKTVRDVGPSIGYSHVLVMDDEEPVRDVLGQMLGLCQCEVEYAKNGDQALTLLKQRLIEQHPFDLAILDLFIPGGRGAKEIINEIRSVAPHLKILVASGFHLDNVMTDYSQYGFDGAIKKPFCQEDLMNILYNI